jgi:hypothetical protein
MPHHKCVTCHTAMRHMSHKPAAGR